MELRDDFPFFKNNPNTAYFDSAATALKPKQVIEAVSYYYEHLSSNIHRGDYSSASETETRYEAVRQKVGKLLNTDAKNIIFTSGASESLNLVAHAYGRHFLKKGDTVLITEAEHASNTLPWFALMQEIGIKVGMIPLDENGTITPESLESVMDDSVKLIAVGHVSNVLAYTNDVKSMAAIAHRYGAYISVDGAQSVGHMAVDVEAMDLDFFSFSAHKMLGPSGVGVLYAKPELLEMMIPLNTGGGNNVSYNVCGDVVLKKAPAKFESGTPNIEGVLGFGAAIDYINHLGFDTIHAITQPIHQYLLKELLKMNHVKVYNPHADNPIITFSVEGIFAQDVAFYLNSHNISVRSGEHCAKILNGALQMEKSVRLSLYFYNTMEEADRFLEAIRDITLEKTIDLYI